MSTTPISLFTFTSDAANPAPTGDRGVLPEGAEGFAAIFSGFVNKGTGDQTAVEQTVTCAPGGLAAEFAKLLPQLLKLYSNNVTDGIEVSAAGTIESTGQTLTELSGAGGDQPTAQPGPDGVELLQRLLAAVAALFAAQQKGEAESTQACGESESDGDKDTQATDGEIQAQAGNAEPELTISADDPATLDKGIAQMVALLLYAYLQSAQDQTTEQKQIAAPENGAMTVELDPGLDETLGGTGPDAGQTAAGAALQGGSGARQSSASAGTRASKELEELLQKMMAAAQEKPGTDGTEETTGRRVEVQLTVLKETLKGAADTSAAIKTDPKAAAPTRPSIDTLLPADGKGGQAAQQDTSSTMEMDNASETFVKGVSQIFEALEQQQNKGETETNDQQAPKENYQVLADREPAAKGAVEQKGAVQQASPTHAVEKFEKVLEQFSAKSGLNEMRVRLNIGNDESVILGMKDLGQNISVEVKASHQAIIGLLESQKETITKNLEARDIHTNMFIDPDSSAKQDQKDRREGKQRMRMSRSRNQADGFAEVLEVLS
jgi:hypothetical protein